MAENIVKTNTNKTSQLSQLTQLVNAIAVHVGLVPNSDESSPKTSARLKSRESAPAMARGTKGHDDVAITLTEAMIDGRMKLPARMFTKGSKVVVDGHTFTQQPQDQNRSTKFDPSIFGDVNVGDVITFEFVSGREWTVADIASGGGKRKGRKTSTAKPSAKTQPKGKTQPSNGKVARSEGGTSSIKSEIRKFADMCIENASDEDFEENENIKATGSMGDSDDARIYLTTAQNQKFRSFRKRNGLTLRKAVGMLNELVFED